MFPGIIFFEAVQNVCVRTSRDQSSYKVKKSLYMSGAARWSHGEVIINAWGLGMAFFDMVGKFLFVLLGPL